MMLPSPVRQNPLPSTSMAAFRLGPLIVRTLPALALLAVGLSLTTIRGLNTWDETWFLQVADRLARGEVLYRDVFFPSTPLSAYLTAAAVALLGSHILVLKGIQTLVFTATVLLCGRIGGQLRLWRDLPLSLALAFLVYAPPGAAGPGHLYGALANLFVLASFSATLSWRERARDDAAGSAPHARTWVPLGVAGVAAGLAIASKHDIGSYGLAASLLTTLIGSQHPRTSLWNRTTAGGVVGFVSLLTVALILLPVRLSGALDRFLDQALLNTAEYLRAGILGYLDEFRGGLALPQGLPTLPDLDRLYRQSVFLLAPLAALVLVAAWRQKGGGDRRQTSVVLAFTGAGLLAAFPRSDIHHVTHTVPQMLLAIAYGFHCLARAVPMSWSFGARWSLRAWLPLGLGLMIAVPLTGLASGALQVSTLPHVTGPLITVQGHRAMEANARDLAREVAGQGATFILSPSAGLYYLLSGLQNPTPYDFPLTTAFGVNGQEEVIAAITAGRIRQVCLARPHPDLQPVRLVTYVQSQMEPYQDLGWCTLYRAWSTGTR